MPSSERSCKWHEHRGIQSICQLGGSFVEVLHIFPETGMQRKDVEGVNKLIIIHKLSCGICISFGFFNMMRLSKLISKQC